MTNFSLYTSSLVESTVKDKIKMCKQYSVFSIDNKVISIKQLSIFHQKSTPLFSLLYCCYYCNKFSAIRSCDVTPPPQVGDPPFLIIIIGFVPLINQCMNLVNIK